ncbi:MAG: potassium channel family protein [Gemmatimonadetes bacterium]|nr:potassium channel family protein [Gemmatimonadota bacterium]
MLRKWVRRLMLAACFVVFVVSGGTIGYMLIEGQSLGDSLYMAAITVSAVGYSEIFPLSTAGRALTLSLLVAGITAIAVWFATITEALVEYDLKRALGDWSIGRELRRVNGHVIVCGAGRTGRLVAGKIRADGLRCVMIEVDEGKIRQLKEDGGGEDLYRGDATSDEVLRRAGVTRAVGLVACLTRDADSLFVCLSARTLGPEGLRIVARVRNEESVAKMKRAGADQVVSPSVSTALSLVEYLEMDVRNPNTGMKD